MREIIRSSVRAMEYASTRTRQSLEAEPMFADAVYRRLEIIGEAAKRVSEFTKAQTPEVPWQKIIRTRNRIAHTFNEIDNDIVWEITQSHLPTLVQEVNKVLK